METLYDRLKPELLGKLMKNRTKYEYTVNKCITLLKSTHRYHDLTIDDANMVSTFAEADWVNASCVEFRHGGYMFNEPTPTTNE